MPDEGGGNARSKPRYEVIEKRHMDMRKFYTLSVLNSVLIRAVLYPSVLIKTRLMVQKTGAVYSSATDAFIKIIRTERVRGLYRGFGAYVFSSFPGVFYIIAYENVRNKLSNSGYSHSVQSLCAGGAASLVGQTFMVPVDVVGQHLMMSGRKDLAQHVIGETAVPRNASIPFIVRTLHKEFGIAGIYKGYWSSLFTYGTNSALWWYFYHIYTGEISHLAPSVPLMLCHGVSGPLAGVTAAAITNPLDVVRARMQVEGRKSAYITLKALVEEEGFLAGSAKGITARMFNAAFASFILTIFYELSKRLSIKEEHAADVRW